MKETKLLIVVDMQNDFINGSLGTPEAQAIVPNVIKKIESWDGKIICSMDTHGEDYFSIMEGKKLPIKHCIKDTHGWDIPIRIARMINVNENAAIIHKSTFGAATLLGDIALWQDSPNKELLQITSDMQMQTFFDNFINIGPLSEIQLIGLCTDICVVSNALLAKAFFPEVPIVVDASCCAGTTPENHKAALQVMKCCQIDIINEGEENL